MAWIYRTKTQRAQPPPTPNKICIYLNSGRGRMSNLKNAPDISFIYVKQLFIYWDQLFLNFSFSLKYAVFYGTALTVLVQGEGDIVSLRGIIHSI